MKTYIFAGTLLFGATSLAWADSPTSRAIGWTGLYLGANLGVSWQRADSTNTVSPNSPSSIAPSISSIVQDGIIPGSSSQDAGGLLGGATVGFNYRSGVLVYGVEADWMWTGIKRASSETHDASNPGWLVTTVTEAKLDWLATVRGRAGVLASPLAYLYATGGLAIGNVEGSSSAFTGGAGNCTVVAMTNVVCGSGSVSGTKLGWAVGAGADYLISPNWTVRIEYLYYDLGHVSYSTFGNSPAFPLGEPRLSVDTRIAGSIGRLGLTYQFNSVP